MAIDYLYILAAGHGTRMGNIGEQLPKPLWPIYDRTLVALQIEFAKRFNYKKAFINIHHQREQLENFFARKEMQHITPLYEDELLGIGGAIHNLASCDDIKYKGIALIINCDQFIMFEPDFIERMCDKIIHEECDAVLFGTEVAADSPYNRLKLDGDRLVKVVPAGYEKNYQTYCGSCLINLNKIKPHPGKSDFFKTVINPNIKTVVTPINHLPYWDFGTTQRYWDSIHKILSEAKYDDDSSSLFVKFLLETEALKISKTDRDNHSYNSRFPGILNFSQCRDHSSLCSSAILLNANRTITMRKQGIYWNEQFDPI